MTDVNCCPSVALTNSVTTNWVVFHDKPVDTNYCDIDTDLIKVDSGDTSNPDNLIQLGTLSNCKNGANSWGLLNFTELQ